MSSAPSSALCTWTENQLSIELRMNPTATRNSSTAGTIATSRKPPTSRVRRCEPSTRWRRSTTNLTRFLPSRNTTSRIRTMLRLMRRKKTMFCDTASPVVNGGRRVSNTRNRNAASTVAPSRNASRRRQGRREATGAALAGSCAGSGVSPLLGPSSVGPAGGRDTTRPRSLTGSSPEQPQQRRQHDAHHDRRRDRQVEGEVVTLDQDVAGQPAEAERY